MIVSVRHKSEAQRHKVFSSPPVAVFSFLFSSCCCAWFSHFPLCLCAWFFHFPVRLCAWFSHFPLCLCAWYTAR
jgi:hypothetical protein